MAYMKTLNNNHAQGLAWKAVIAILITAVLATLVYVQQPVYAEEEIAGLIVTKTVLRDSGIVGDGSGNGGNNYQPVYDGNVTVARTNTLRFSVAMENISEDPIIVDLTAMMPTNCILFFDMNRGDNRMVTGTQLCIADPPWANTYAYIDVNQAWWVSEEPNLNEYRRSISAVTQSSSTNPFALGGPHMLSLDNVTIQAFDTYTFEYAVIVWPDDPFAAEYAITDDFYINGEQTAPFTLYNSNLERTLSSNRPDGTVPVGETVTYMLALKSVGTRVDVELEIPAGTAYVDSSLNVGGLTASVPVVGSDSICFAIADAPMLVPYTISYTVLVSSGAIAVDNTRTSVNQTLLNPVNLVAVSGDIGATGYGATILPSEGIVAGQEITYTANVFSSVGTIANAVVTVQLPMGTEFIGAACSEGSYVVDNGVLMYTLPTLGASYVNLEFTLKLQEDISGDLSVHFTEMVAPPEWIHPILVVTKSLKRDKVVAKDMTNNRLPGYGDISDGATVEFQDLVLFIYTVKNTGSTAVAGMHISAETPDNMALYITFKSSQAFGKPEADNSYHLSTGIIANGVTLPYGYNDLAYAWDPVQGTDYEKSVEALEKNNPTISSLHYAPFTICKDNVALAPDEECDFRYAAFVNSNVEGTEFSDDFTVNGVATKPVSVFIPGYGIASDPAPLSTVAVGNVITYTVTMPAQAISTEVYADIPNGTSLVIGSVVSVTTSEEPMVIVESVDKLKLVLPLGTESVSYQVLVERPVKVYVNNVNINGKYFSSITHSLLTTAPHSDVVLGYTFISEQNNNYVGYDSRMTFMYYVHNSLPNTITDVVITVPMDTNLRLDPSSIPYWYGTNAVIVDKHGAEWKSDLLAQKYTPADFSVYDDLGPHSVRWTIPSIEAGQTVSVLNNGVDLASELAFAGYVKSEVEVNHNADTITQTAYLTYSGAEDYVYADTLIYYFPPRTFVVLSCDAASPANAIYTPAGADVTQGVPVGAYAYGDVIHYVIDIKNAEVVLTGMTELFVSSTIPAAADLVLGSIHVFKGLAELTEPSDVKIDLDNPGKIRVRIYVLDETDDYQIQYSVRITSYKGMLRTYAIGQVLKEDIQKTRDVPIAASETNIFQHNIDTPYSTVTINNQLLVDALGNELDEILQNGDKGLGYYPVDFVITFTDEIGNEYNAVMQNGGASQVFYGLPYNVPLTISEVGTSDTVFKEAIDSTGGVSGVEIDNGKYTFVLADTDTGRNLSFTIVSEYCPSGGFSSASSKNNMFSVPNFDFTSLLKYQLKDLASTQIDNGPGDGAIPIADDALSYNFATQRFSIRPYFSMTAASSFLLDPDYYDCAKRYLEWHIAHLNEEDLYGVPGSIYDYYYSLVGDERRAFTMAESDNTVDVYDSTDSYAALFFELLLRYYSADRSSPLNPLDDDSLIKKEILDLVLDCLVFSFSSSPLVEGDALLTVAKPKNYEIEFLMDNCEVYRGFLSLKRLYALIQCPTEADQAADYADRIKLGIQGLLYDSTSGTYDYALLNPSEIGEWYYPDAIAQVFPILFDVIDPNGSMDPGGEGAIAKNLYDVFKSHFPYWTDMTNVDRRPEQELKLNRGGGASVFPSVLLAKAAVKMGDLDGVALAFKNIEKLYRQQGNPFPFLCYESGETALSIFDFMNAYYAYCGETFTEVPVFQGKYPSP